MNINVVVILNFLAGSRVFQKAVLTYRHLNLVYSGNLACIALCIDAMLNMLPHMTMKFVHKSLLRNRFLSGIIFLKHLQGLFWS